MPLPERFAHWQQAADEELLDYDVEEMLTLPAIEERARVQHLPWRACDAAFECGYVPEDE